MFNSQSYGKWQIMLAQLLPDSCQSRIKNMSLLIVGMFMSQSVYLSVIARKLPIRAKKLSLAKRLERFLDNKAIDVDTWYGAWRDGLLKSASSGGRVHLLVDTTKVSAHHRLLMISVAYQRRSLPIMWDWVAYSRGHCSAEFQIKLLKRLKRVLPPNISVSLVGDSEFGSVKVIRQLKKWQWDYALRQKGRTLFRATDQDEWQRIDAIAIQPGQFIWLEGIQLTQDAACPTHLVIYWRRGEKDPWYLATNQSGMVPTIRLYKRRVWIEEMFGDMKGHGFDLELSRLRTADRLSRLTLAVSILYVWLVTTGEYVLHHRLTHEIDRHDRRDLSIFRLGWDFLERRFVFNDPIPIFFRPNFCLVSGC